jgi:hypothetical protein
MQCSCIEQPGPLNIPPANALHKRGVRFRLLDDSAFREQQALPLHCSSMQEMASNETLVTLLQRALTASGSRGHAAVPESSPEDQKLKAAALQRRKQLQQAVNLNDESGMDVL